MGVEVRIHNDNSISRCKIYAHSSCTSRQEKSKEVRIRCVKCVDTLLLLQRAYGSVKPTERKLETAEDQFEIKDYGRWSMPPIGGEGPLGPEKAGGPSLLRHPPIH